jgi:hypothetical protein
MFLAIVIVSVMAGIIFVVGMISIIVIIYSVNKKNDILRRLGFKILIPTAIIWVLFLIVDIVLFVKDRDNIAGEVGRLTGVMVGSGFEAAGEGIGKGFAAAGEGIGSGIASAAQSFEKNWDKGRLQQLQNLHISFSSINYEIQNETKLYDIELIFDNKSPAEIKLYLDDLIGNHYLTVCDKDDFVYTIPLFYTNIRKTQTKEQADDGVKSKTETTSTQYSDTIIPFGKSKYRFNVTVPNDVDITHARFVNTVIPFK